MYSVSFIPMSVALLHALLNAWWHYKETSLFAGSLVSRHYFIQSIHLIDCLPIISFKMLTLFCLFAKGWSCNVHHFVLIYLVHLWITFLLPYLCQGCILLALWDVLWNLMHVWACDTPHVLHPCRIPFLTYYSCTHFSRLRDVLASPGMLPESLRYS